MIGCSAIQNPWFVKAKLIEQLSSTINVKYKNRTIRRVLN